MSDSFIIPSSFNALSQTFLTYPFPTMSYFISTILFYMMTNPILHLSQTYCNSSVRWR